MTDVAGSSSRFAVTMLCTLLATALLVADCRAEGGYWKYVGSRLQRCANDTESNYCTAAGGRNALKFSVTGTDGEGHRATDIAMLRWEINGRVDALVPGQKLAMQGTLAQQLNTAPCIGLDARFGWRDPVTGLSLSMGASIGPERPVDSGAHTNSARWSFIVPPRGGSKRSMEFAVEGHGGHRAAVLYDYEWTEGPVPAAAPLPIALPARAPGGNSVPCLVRILRGSARIGFGGSARAEVSPGTASELALGEGTEASCYIGDTVSTVADTRAELIFPDGTRFVIKSNSRVTVLNDAIHLDVGGAWLNIRKLGGHGFQVVTPDAASACLGTTFAVEVEKDGTALCAVGDGVVAMWDKARKKQVTIAAGKFSSCKPGGTPSEPRPYDATMKVRLFGEDGEKGVPVPIIQAEGGGATAKAPGPEEPLKIQARATSSAPLEGTWTVAFNGIPGQMTLQPVGDRWTGSLDLDAGPEELRDIDYDAASGRVRFVRPSVDQHYIGVLGGGEIKGSFGDSEDQSYWEWSAKRD